MVLSLVVVSVVPANDPAVAGLLALVMVVSDVKWLIHRRPPRRGFCDRRLFLGCRQMPELFRIGHDVDRPDSSIADVHRKNGVWLTIQIIHDGGLPIDLHDAWRQVPWEELRETAQNAARDPVGTMQ